MSYLVYTTDRNDLPEPELPQGYSFQLWRPSFQSFFPPTLGRMDVLWTFAYYLRVMRNRDYTVLQILDSNNNAVHLCCSLPACFRWPFMMHDDLMIGVWTAPEQRGKGLATLALRKIVTLLGHPNRKFWYVVNETNRSSIAVCEKAGFSFMGRATRTSFLGIHMLDRLLIEK